MPVTKYRSVQEMPLVEPRREVDLGQRIRAVLARAVLLCPPLQLRGVERFRSIEQANESRSQKTAQRMQRIAGTRTP